MKIAITVDIETDWGGRDNEYRGITQCLPEILDLLTKYEIKATFFVQGCLASRCKESLLSISAKGHEIASHGQEHVSHTSLDSNELFYQLSKSKDVLETITNTTVKGFRAPQSRLNPLLFKLLNEAGYKYDSSIISQAAILGRYNYRDFPVEPFLQNNIVEIPTSSMPIIHLPMGLRWMNLIGIKTYTLLEKANTSSDLKVFYMHPFDTLKDKTPYKREISLRLWYGFKNNHTFNTLKTIIEFWHSKGCNFLTLEDIYNSFISKTPSTPSMLRRQS